MITLRRRCRYGVNTTTHFSCIEHLTSQRKYDELIFTAADGKVFDQGDANELSLKTNLIILCGHYKGVDQRVRDALITKEYSIGDVVLSGGELPAMVITDAIVRLLPGAIGDAESALKDSFQDGMLEAPVYTRPARFKGMDVPEVLRSGNFKKLKPGNKSNLLRKQKNDDRIYLIRLRKNINTSILHGQD